MTVINTAGIWYSKPIDPTRKADAQAPPVQARPPLRGRVLMGSQILQEVTTMTIYSVYTRSGQDSRRMVLFDTSRSKWGADRIAAQARAQGLDPMICIDVK